MAVPDFNLVATITIPKSSDLPPVSSWPVHPTSSDLKAYYLIPVDSGPEGFGREIDKNYVSPYLSIPSNLPGNGASNITELTLVYSIADGVINGPLGRMAHRFIPRNAEHDTVSRVIKINGFSANIDKSEWGDFGTGSIDNPIPEMPGAGLYIQCYGGEDTSETDVSLSQFPANWSVPIVIEIYARTDVIAGAEFWDHFRNCHEVV